jgi:malic enzyme
MKPRFDEEEIRNMKWRRRNGFKEEPYKALRWAGKIAVTPEPKWIRRRSSPSLTRPGVAEPCLIIRDNIDQSYRAHTEMESGRRSDRRTAGLGLGIIGPKRECR